MSREQNPQTAATRAWEEFGKPLAGSTIGNPPRQGSVESDEIENQFQQDSDESQELEAIAQKNRAA